MAEQHSLQVEPVYREMADRVIVEVARNLRQRETGAEDMLWAAIRNRRLWGLKFRRQHPIAGTPYIVDFLCYEARLIIELDGEIHHRQVEQNQIRQTKLINLGYTMIRFANQVVFDALASVLQQITLASQKFSNALPLPEGEGQG